MSGTGLLLCCRVRTKEEEEWRKNWSSEWSLAATVSLVFVGEEIHLSCCWLLVSLRAYTTVMSWKKPLVLPSTKCLVWTNCLKMTSNFKWCPSTISSPHVEHNHTAQKMSFILLFDSIFVKARSTRMSHYKTRPVMWWNQPATQKRPYRPIIQEGNQTCSSIIYSDTSLS